MKAVTTFGLSGEGEVDEETFVQEMKEFVSQSDAKERVKEFSDLIFGIIDANNDEVISYNSLRMRHSFGI